MQYSSTLDPSSTLSVHLSLGGITGGPNSINHYPGGTSVISH